MASAFPYATPRSFMSGRLALDAVSRGLAWPLNAGAGTIAFSFIEISVSENSAVQPILLSRPQYEKGEFELGKELTLAVEQKISRLTTTISKFAGFDLCEPVLMGVVNVTPDSFSDGGQFFGTDKALTHALSLKDEGAAIIDVGGESTRPGADPVAPDDEVARVVPLVRSLSSEGVCVSIDTRHAKVMAAAIDAGARIVNDVTALEGDTEALRIVANANVAVILMHMQGKPQTMQDNPIYGWAPGDVFDYLSGRIGACVCAGVKPENIAVDPGIGFGKNLKHNADIMNHLSMFLGLGHPLVIGASRKSFIGRMSAGEHADKRLPGSLAAALHAASSGAHILRVHDAAETRQALQVAKRLT